MVISLIRFLIVALSLALALPAQATTLKILKRFDSTDSVLFLQNDWNPADGNTYWGAIEIGSNNNGTDLYNLEFLGTYVAGSFVIGNDPWETVSIKSHAGEQFDLRGTQEIQLVARPEYATSNPYISVVLRLIMQDGSIWDQPKVMANNVWQAGAFPVKEGSFARAEWGHQGVFDLGKVVSWEIILVDLPPGNSHINFHTMYIKGNYDTPENTSVAEPFGVNFFAGDGSILFRHTDWNPTDGDTHWLYHVRKHPHYYNPYGFVRAVYRSEGDPWETVSLRKEAQIHFDLTTNNRGQIVVLVDAGLNLDPNALIMSLTMQDGSIWQQGKPLDVVRKTILSHQTPAGDVVVPYRFSLDPQGKGWTMAAWGPPGSFDLSRIKAWELSFNNLEQGAHTVLLSSIDIMEASLVNADSAFEATGQAQWLELSFAADGIVAEIGSEGGVEDSLSIVSETPPSGLGLGFNLEITSSYANPSPDAVVFKLTTSDGKIWQQAYSLPEAGRSVLRIYTGCPSPSMARPDPDDFRCKGILGGFYGMTSGITKWEIKLNSPPAGEYKIGINLLPTIQ
ncbi:hypothetical protein [Nitrosomonas communis]|uniref:hypothetical protein n=1 Tax=Nitrosomonas communis TaxID=44574 RepID=UPI0026F364B5|nr:hypothetical protein [Nitrosomonas communis]MCO6426671.1 hypothetical protein [Nitrosomonas communis]